MEPSKLTGRLRIIRALLIVGIAANLAFSIRTLPLLLSANSVSTATLGELGRVYEERMHNGRGVCLTLYERYRSPSLRITPGALEYLGVEESILRRYCRASDLRVVEESAIPAQLSGEQPVAETVEFGSLEERRLAVFVQHKSDAPVELVYAVMIEGRLTFVPASGEAES